MVRVKDAYFFIREFEKVCIMMSIYHLGDNVVSLRFIPFTYKELAKKWIYNLAVDSFTSWDNFFKAFLQKFFPIHKTALKEEYHAFQTRN